MPCKSLILACATLSLAAVAASPASAAYISLWDSGANQAMYGQAAGHGYSNWNGSPNNPPNDVIAGAVVVCPDGLHLSADHLWCVSH
jgi:hypothetical protein